MPTWLLVVIIVLAVFGAIAVLRGRF